MNRAGTAREALIVEALGDVALLLDRVESLTASVERHDRRWHRQTPNSETASKRLTRVCRR